MVSIQVHCAAQKCHDNTALNSDAQGVLSRCLRHLPPCTNATDIVSDKRREATTDRCCGCTERPTKSGTDACVEVAPASMPQRCPTKDARGLTIEISTSSTHARYCTFGTARSAPREGRWSASCGPQGCTFTPLHFAVNGRTCTSTREACKRAATNLRGRLHSA